MWYIYIMKYYPAANKNEIMNFAGKWKELEKFTLSEHTQIQIYNHHKSSFIGSSKFQVSRCEDLSCSNYRNQESKKGLLWGRRQGTVEREEIAGYK